MYKSAITIVLVLDILVVSSCCAASAFPGLKEDTIIETCHGTIRGTIELARNNRTYFSFRGIPYAKPPIGKLRFKAPVPPDPWKGILDAQKDAPICIQKDYFFMYEPVIEGSEDCLYLNVYTPKLPVKKETPRKQKLLPVMVFIHYGGFFSGSSHSDILGAEYFMDADVVLVTFNYRVGIFGFFSTSDDAAPGNWGFKDQVAVLKWVRDNIGGFGGDNRKVTIFGTSAGAGSVHYHLLSPTTKGLFHSAISESGSALAIWAKPQNELQIQIAQLQAKFVGCDSENDTQVIVDCLREVDAADLVNSGDNFKYFQSEPLIVFFPVVEKVTDKNPFPYMIEPPMKTVLKGTFHNVPWIIGVTSDEGILRVAPLLRQSKTRKTLLEKFDEIGPQMLAVRWSVDPTTEIDTWEKMTQYYLGDDNIDISNPSSVQGFINMYSDRTFNFAAYQSALLHAAKGHNPIWFYNFAYRGSYTYGDWFAATTEDIRFKWGVSHCDNLLYLFSSKKLFPPLKPNTPDEILSKKMIKMWTSFATYGHPTPLNDPLAVRPIWEPLPRIDGVSVLKNSDLRYLNISGSNSGFKDAIRFEMDNNFYPERMKFWNELPLAENVEGFE